MTTRSKEHGDCDTSVTESSNMADFTTSKLKSRTDDDFDDSLASFAPKVSFQDAANADCSFSFRCPPSLKTFFIKEAFIQIRGKSAIETQESISALYNNFIV